MLFVRSEYELILSLEQLNAASLLTTQKEVSIRSEFNCRDEVLELEDLG